MQSRSKCRHGYKQTALQCGFGLYPDVRFTCQSSLDVTFDVGFYLSVPTEVEFGEVTGP